MMKRSTKESVEDDLASKELYVPASKTPAVTEAKWHIDPASLKDNDELQRKSPEAKYLQALSACITVMVLWGIFWQVRNHLIPQLLYNSEASSQGDSSITTQIKSYVDAFRGDFSADLVSRVSGRREVAKRLLNVRAEQIPDEQRQTDGESWGGNSRSGFHRKLQISKFLLSEPEHPQNYQLSKLFRRLRLRYL